MNRAAGWLGAGVALVLGSAIAGPAAAQEEDYPRILKVDASRPPQVSLEAVVPPMLAGQTLPASAFYVTENGRRLPVTSATRLAPKELRVLLVLDTAVPGDVLAAEQGAARDFVFRLPALTRIGVVAADPEPAVVAPPDADRSLTTRALVNLRSQPATATNDVVSSMALALEQLPAGPGLNVVIPVDSRPVTQAMPAAVSQRVAATQATVYPITLQEPPLGYLGGLAASSGGRVLPVEEPEGLLSAYDVVANELLGRYRLGFATTTGASHPADLTVRFGGVEGTAAFVVQPAVAPTQAGKATRGPDGSTRNRSGVNPMRVLAGLLAFALLGRLAWRFAHRS